MQISEIYLEFKNAGDLIRLEPIDLNYPTATEDWDRSWVKTKISVKAGVFSGHFNANCMTMDFELFKQRLKILDNDFNAIATFEPLENCLSLKISGDGLGHFELHCEVSPNPPEGEKLSFVIDFDQTEIKNYIRQLDKITKAFPIKGDFKIQNE